MSKLSDRFCDDFDAVSEQLKARGNQGNTPLANRQGVEIRDFGIEEDTVHILTWVDWGLRETNLFDKLKSCQEEAKRVAEKESIWVFSGRYSPCTYTPQVDADKPKDDLFVSEYKSKKGSCKIVSEDQEICIGGVWWTVKPYPLRKGNGYAPYDYILVAGGVTLMIRRTALKTAGNLRIELGSIPLMQWGGLANLWAVIEKILYVTGITIEKDLISRIDIKRDITTVSATDMSKKHFEGCRITRARKSTIYGEEEKDTATYVEGHTLTGFSIGKNIKLRVYDKARELKKAGNAAKYALIKLRYGAEVPKVLTRIEFQLRREAIKTLKVADYGRIDTVEDWLKCRASIWTYLTTSWYRMTDAAPDRKNRHQDRTATYIPWQAVSDLRLDIYEVTRAKRLTVVHIENLYRQGISCLVKCAVFDGKTTVSQVAEYIHTMIAQDYSENRARLGKIINCCQQERDAQIDFALSTDAYEDVVGF